MKQIAKEKSILESIKQDLIEIIEFAQSITLLELELDLNKRLYRQKLNAIEETRRVNQEALTNTERNEIWSFIKSLTSRPKNEKLTKRQNELVEQAVSERVDVKDLRKETTNCFFDEPQNLQIIVSYTDRPKIVIDIIKSIKNDPQNIGHPLIVQAIKRYAQLSAQQTQHPRIMSSKTARDNLKKITDAIISGEEAKAKRGKRDAEDVILQLGLVKFPQDYFRNAWEILHEKETKAIQSPTNKASRIRRRMTTEYSAFDHQDLTDFFKAAFKANSGPIRERLLPKKNGGGDALRNAFFRWKLGGKHNSVKVRLSEVRRKFEDLFQGVNTPFSEDELNDSALKVQRFEQD